MPIGKVQKTVDQYVVVVIERQDMCGECHACDVISEKKTCELKCINKCKGKEGDFVEIDLSKDSFLKATFIMYGIPLIGLFMGVLMRNILPPAMGESVKDVIAIILGLSFMSLGFIVIKLRDKQHKYNELLPIAKKVVCK